MRVLTVSEPSARSRPRAGWMVEDETNVDWWNGISWSPRMTSRNLQQAVKGCCAADSAQADRNDDGDDNKASKCNPASQVTSISTFLHTYSPRKNHPILNEKCKVLPRFSVTYNLSRKSDTTILPSPGARAQSGAGYRRVWRSLSPTSHVDIPWFQYLLN